MKKIVYILKLIFLISGFYNIASCSNLDFITATLLLIIIGINIYKEKYNDSIYVAALGFIVTCAGIHYNKEFAVLICISIFDFTANKNIIGVLSAIAFETYSLYNTQNIKTVILISVICCLFGYIIETSNKKEISLKNSLDAERKLRYELESVKAKLLNSSKEIAHLTETYERNRIAREIHDNVGHRATGILIQLQAAYKLMGRNDEKSKEVLKKSIDALAETVTLLRDTVYNIKPSEKLGLEYIKNIVQNFSFCNVNFKFTGDFNTINPILIEIIGTNIKETLTNAAKYSSCTNIIISIDINEMYIRLYTKDNGSGCKNIKEGLGLSGMRERIENIGGSMSISPDDGFMMVCIIPLNMTNKGA